MTALTNGLTDQGKTIALIVGAVLLVGIVLLIATRYARSNQKDRWVDRIATVLVLAWTSEGMWQVATTALHLPTKFVFVTFFVVESMMVSSAMRATAHRLSKGIPGPAGTLVWVLAGTFGSLVALNESTVVGAGIRLALPLLAAAQWWQGLTAERDTDTEEMKKARAVRALERRATWAVTPRDLMVRLGLMKPGKTSTTEAQRELHINRMVKARTVIYNGTRGANPARGVKRARVRLQRLARTATAEMVAEVQRQVQQTVHIEVLSGPATDLQGGATPATAGATDPATAPATGSATAVQRPSSALQGIDPQLAAIVRNGRPGSGTPNGGRNGKNAQVSVGATERTDATFMAIVQPLVARSLDATGTAPSQRSVRNEIEKRVQPAPGFKKVGELIERATASHREHSESGATAVDGDRNDDPDRRINGHSHDLIGASL